MKDNSKRSDYTQFDIGDKTGRYDHAVCKIMKAVSEKIQIGKGMYPAPDLMNNMMKQKIAHPLSGANCAWVPSPTAAALHVLHYHEVDVFDKQRELLKRKPVKLSDLLTIPLAKKPKWSMEDIANELKNKVLR